MHQHFYEIMIWYGNFIDFMWKRNNIEIKMLHQKSFHPIVHCDRGWYLLKIAVIFSFSGEKSRICLSGCILVLTVSIITAQVQQPFKSPKLNGILNLLPKLFWPTVRKNCSSDREKLLKFEAEGLEFAKILRSLEQFIQTVKVQNNFW